MIVSMVSKQLLLSEEYLHSVARSATYRYREYEIPKRSGGTRTIHHPARELKVIQRALLPLVRAWPVHRAACAYEPGMSPKRHAEFHRQARYLMRVDLVAFFPSIRTGDFYRFSQRHSHLFAGWSSDDWLFFVRCVFRRGRLTIGAPTSPSLANRLCLELDETIEQACTESGVTYTRYADDMYFSCDVPGVLPSMEGRIKGILRSLDLPASLKVSTRKTLHMSRRQRRIVTGLTITQEEKLSTGRRLKRFVRGLLHRITSLTPDERASLAGYLAYLEHVEPEVINRLELKYGAAVLASARS